jgi:hypothetical protein
VVLACASGCYHGTRARDAADDVGDTESGPGSADATESDGDGSDDDDDSDPLISECRRPSYEVFQRLSPTCAGCHDEGTTVPLAADFPSFEQLVIYNEDLVQFGRPDESVLLTMLAGEAPPPLEQMPPGAVSFAELAERGATEIAMDELAAWIEDLEPCDVPGGDLSPRFVRRAGAEQIRASLMDQLDLTLADVEHASRFPIDDPSFPELPSGHNSSRSAEARWQALGGPNFLQGDVRNNDFGPLFIQALGPTAQAYCRSSITLGRDALFRHASRDSDSSQDEAAIRDNIRFLFLKMLGIDADDEEVDAMYRAVYLPYESAQDSTTAWVAVCAAFVRHPLWVSY